MIGPLETQATTLLSNTKASLVDQFNAANSYNNMRIFGQMGLVLVYILPVLVINPDHVHFTRRGGKKTRMYEGVQLGLRSLLSFALPVWYRFLVDGCDYGRRVYSGFRYNAFSIC